MPDDHISRLLSEFNSNFKDASPLLYSAPGRTEIGGNHTDHQHGKVLAAAVDMDMTSAAAKNGTNIVRIRSDGYAPFQVDLSLAGPQEAERGAAAALVRGICLEIAALGYEVGGFDACVSSRVLQGSGLSSSAAFEVLTGAVVNGLFCNDELDATALAIVGQRAENRYFGKPCGLMDQMASAWGGVVAIDFMDPEKPYVRKLSFDFSSVGYSLCIVDVAADHASLTSEYAAIPAEMHRVSHYFGKSCLREVPPEDFFGSISALRAQAGDRAVLRAMHFFNENALVDELCGALDGGDFDSFLTLVRRSGRSSWMYLQNVVVSGSVEQQAAALALALCDRALGERGAFRIHGGGFGGTVQAFVPDELLESFRNELEAVFGPGSCHVMHIRPLGVTRL